MEKAPKVARNTLPKALPACCHYDKVKTGFAIAQQAKEAKPKQSLKARAKVSTKALSIEAHDMSLPSWSRVLEEREMLRAFQEALQADGARLPREASRRLRQLDFLVHKEEQERKAEEAERKAREAERKAREDKADRLFRLKAERREAARERLNPILLSKVTKTF